MHRRPLDAHEYTLLDPAHIPAGEDELSLRDEQHMTPRAYRALSPAEVSQLQRQGCEAARWSDVEVASAFDASLVHGCRFFGRVRLGALAPQMLESGELARLAGIYHSTIVACDIGDHVAIHGVAHLAHMIVGDEVLIANCARIATRPGARFGCGGARAGEPAASRRWCEVGNESGGRRIVPFAGMLPADAWLWSRLRGDAALGERLTAFSDAAMPREGMLGSIGRGTALANCGPLIDVEIGEAARVMGALRIEDVTIRSNAHEPATIGAGVELAHGVVGLGCTVASGARAFHFVLGTQARLLLGARLLHSFLCDNSTVACCEVQHSLVLPNHEQHHNNSFLIAATVGGQSNVAAGATLGSNHNSRTPDGELLAGRGFWPGLCTSFKYPSRFASFVLIATGTYAHELNVPFPFSLVSRDDADGTLQIAPAWAFRHNMYAVQRNASKYTARDKRVHKEQHIEFATLAPDTIEEMLAARELLERMIAEMPVAAFGAGEGKKGGGDSKPSATMSGIENSARATRILRPAEAFRIYGEMAQHYAVRVLLEALHSPPIAGMPELRDPRALAHELGSGDPARREREWHNAGGQLIGGAALRRLVAGVVENRTRNWDALHGEYNLLWATYPRVRAEHAFAVLRLLEPEDADFSTAAAWEAALSRAVAMQRRIGELALASRAKDFTSPFRVATYANPAEMERVVGNAHDDPLLVKLQQEAVAFAAQVGKLLAQMEHAQRAGPGAH